MIGDGADHQYAIPMLLLLAAIVLAWLIVALAAVALCVYARRTDDEIARGELPPVIKITSAA